MHCSGKSRFWVANEARLEGDGLLDYLQSFINRNGRCASRCTGTVEFSNSVRGDVRECLEMAVQQPIWV